MFRNRSALLSTVAAFGLLLALSVAPAMAQTATDETTAMTGEDQIIATVNGYEIRTSEVRMALNDVIGQMPNVPVKYRYPFVVEFLIERHLLAQLATRDALNETEDYKRRLRAYQAKALRDTYLAQKLAPLVSEDDIKKAYEDEAKKLTSTERIRARHILVASEKEANSVLDKINAGSKFEDLAKQYSLDGSKDYGGDLGYFTAPEMVPEFSKAAFALKQSEVSKPVKSDFGWHVIKLEDRKMGAAQPYDQVRGAIRNVLVRQKVQDTLNGLREVAKVEILDPDLKNAATETAAQRKALQEKQQKTGVGGAEAEGGTGKGDLLLPESTGN